MREIKAPNPISMESYSIFLGGTIDMGNSDDWQGELKSHFELNCPQLHEFTLFNPRRDDWDSSWVQHIDNPEFNEQVTWELNAMEKADLRLFVFLPNSKSPITLMELGLFKHLPCVVYCPFEFYRSGNVHIVCERYKIPYYTDWDKFKASFVLTTS
jgi:hypothetical protein